MCRSQVLTLSAAVTVMTLSSSSAFKVGSQGRVMWQNNCDFYGDDIHSVQGIPDVCGDLCADEYSECTHWSWTNLNGGTCWLKTGETATTSTYWGAGCGYVIDRFSCDQADQNAEQNADQNADQVDKNDQTIQPSQTDETSDSTPFDNGLTSAESSEMLALINSYRSDNGLSALTIDARLVAAANVHSEDQASRCTMSHDGADGSAAWDRMEDQGYDWTVAAENVAAGQSGVSAVMTSWWNSAGHRANILKDDVVNIGFALVTNSACEYKSFWTQNFGAE